MKIKISVARPYNCTGKSVSEALILQSVNPQYNDRLFIDSWLQYKKNTTSEHVVYKHCFLFMFWSSKQCLYTTCSQLVFFLYWIQEWMHNLSSYCGLTYSRISASEKDLPVSIILSFLDLIPDVSACFMKLQMFTNSKHSCLCIYDYEWNVNKKLRRKSF